MQNLSLFESNAKPFTVNNHLSYNFNGHTDLNVITFSSLTETKSYAPTAGCVLEHVITTTNLTSYEKLYYLSADSLALISKNKGGSRSIALAGEDWAERLNCSRSLIFTMQKSLVKKGYFIIDKGFDGIGRNNRNLITPTLPTKIFNHLNEKYPDRSGEHASYNPLVECKRAYLDRTKLFIKLSYDLLKIITASGDINPRRKMLWLAFYTRGYKNHMLQSREGFNRAKYSYNDDSSNDSNFSFISSYRELAGQYSCGAKYLSKSIRALEALGFIKAQNIYIRKRCGGNDDCKTQARQDKSLWKITLSLPAPCILELEKAKDRSNLKLKEITVDIVEISKNTVDSRLVDPKLVEDCLILGGIKFNLGLEQASLLKAFITDDSKDNGCSEDGISVTYNGNIDTIPEKPYAPPASYIDSITEELGAGNNGNIEGKSGESLLLEDTNFLPNALKTLSASSSIELSHIVEALDDKIKKNGGTKSDPHVAKSRLLLNKDLISKIKNIKSNLGTSSKVLFNNFLRRFHDDELDENSGGKGFNIHSELIRKNLKNLPREKADKARKFAYSLVSNMLAKGYATSLSKHDLAKQLIHHAATWKPTKLGSISRDKEIDTALSVAWKAVVGGTWQIPLALAKVEVLQYEFDDHRRKYRQSGIISHEAKALEAEVNKLLGGFCDLTGKITAGGSKVGENDETSDRSEAGEAGVRALSYRRNTLCNSPASSEQGKEIIYNATRVSASESAGLRFARPDILTINLQADGEMLLSNGHGIEQGNCQPDKAAGYGVVENSYIPYNFSEIDNVDREHLLGSGCLKGDQSSNRSLDVSQIPERQKYLKVTPSRKRGDDSIILETTSGKEYCVRLKELEMNNDGEFVMILKPVKTSLFLQRCSKGRVACLEQSAAITAGPCEVLSLELTENRPLPLPSLKLSLAREQAQEDNAEEGDEFFEEFLRFARKINKDHKRP